MRNKVLIVGGAGYVGGGLVDLLSQKPYISVTVFDSLLYESRFLKPVSFIRGDVRDEPLLKKVLPDFDTIIWLAAVVGDGACAKDPFLTKHINELSVRFLSENVKKSQKVIFISTCSVYGQAEGILLEDGATNPLSIYAETKLAAETYIKRLDNFLIFRLGTLFGVGDKFSRVRLDLVVNAFTKQAVEQQLILVSSPSQWRPVLHVRQVADAILRSIALRLKGTFNLAQANYTISSLASAVQAEFTQVKCHQVRSSDNSKIRNYRVSTKKFTQATGASFAQMFPVGVQEVKAVLIEDRLRDPEDSVYYNQRYLEQGHHLL